MKIHSISKITISAFLIWILVASSLAAPDSDLQRSADLRKTIEYSATVNVSTTTIGSTITLSWTAPEGHPANDYFRLVGVDWQESGGYYWTQTLGTASSGTFIVTVPNAIARYEFQLFRGSDNTRVTQSQPFVANKPNYSVSVNPLVIAAGGQITVNWESPEGRPGNDRLVISSVNNLPVSLQYYTGGANPKSLTFEAPLTPGSYEVGYFEADTPYNPRSALSQIFTVTAADGWFAGRIKNGDTDEYINGALVEVLQQGSVKGSALTNTNGGYNIPLPAAGTYDVRVAANGFQAVMRAGLSVSSGNTTEVNIELTNTGSLSGSISRLGGGTPISGALVHLKQGTSIVASTNTDLAGNYNFARVVSGTYSVEAQATGFAPQTQGNLNLSAGGNLSVNLALAGNQQGTGNKLEFVYDESGRLIATKEQGILTKLYSYDLTGNLLSIFSPSANAPVILGFSPTLGLPGTQVVIRGINFGETAGQNTLSFNGVAATISSLSASELVVTVPASATTGPISVTSPGGAATSSSTFTIGTNTANQPPTVTGFWPTAGHPGDIVTITGSNFENETNDNDVRFGSTGTPVSSGTISSLIVPTSTSSGKISVTTPFGTGTSQYEFVSVPPTVDLTKVDYKGRTWFGNSKYISISNNREGVLTFEATAGKRMSLVVSALSAYTRMDIYRPDGKLFSSSSFSILWPSFWFVDTQTIPLTGTYTIVIVPSGSSGASLRMTIYDVPPDISGEMPLNSYKTVSFGTPGQNGNLTFAAQAGQRILLNVQDHTFGGRLFIQRYLTGNNPNSPFILGSPFVNHGFVPFFRSFTPDGVTIPETGTYNIALDPTGASTGAMSVSLFIVPPDPVFTMNIGSSETVYTSSKGQNAWIDFDGIAGQRVSLRVRDVTFPGGFAISLNKPDGKYLAAPVPAGNGTFVDTLTLPVTGRYKIYVNPPGYDIGNATIDLFDVPADIVATTSINGPPVTVSATVPGHNPSVIFDALQGQQTRVNVSSATVPNNTQIFLKKPDGTVLASTFITSGSGLISSLTLSATGTYKVEVDPVGMNLGSATVSVGGDVFGSVTPGGAASTTTVSNPGQSGRLSFNGTAGQRISAKLTNVTIAAGTVSIRKPDDTVLGSAISIGSNNFIDTVTLPVTGQYSLLIDPYGDYTGSATVNIFNVPLDAAGSISIGSSQTKTTTVPGQNLSLTFSGIANQKITLEMTNVSMTAGIAGVKRPDGSYVSSTGFGSSGAVLSNVVLPLSGTYQIYVDPNSDGVGSVTLQLFGTGTGSSNPTVQLTQAVSIQKGVSSNTRGGLFSSVSVMKGLVSSTNANSTISSSVSVRFGNLQRELISSSVSVRFGNLQRDLISSSISVTTGPNVLSLSPLQITRGSTIVITVSGNNLGTVNALRFLKSDGNPDATFTVTNISVNPEGTVLTATIQTNASATLGERVVVLSTPGFGTSQISSTGANVVAVVQ